MMNSFGWIAPVICWASCALSCLANAGNRESLDSRSPVAAPVLRSAWMLADPSFSLPARPTTPTEERRQLQSHFDRVESILFANTPKSLAIAASRFEAALGRGLPSRQRMRLLAVLASRRFSQLARLRAYRETGRFPLNENPQATLKPIFVDEHGTACAVGHPMICSGWRSQVESISQANNFVVVRDVHDGPLLAWILQSGLTQEEASLIQPFYGPPTHYVGPLSQYLSPGAALQPNGLRFSNFTFSSQQLGAPQFDTSQMQLITDLSDILYTPADLEGLRPNGTRFLALHGALGTTSGTDSLLWRIGFDVAVTNPAHTITAAYLTEDPLHLLTIAPNDSGPPGGPVELHAPDGSLLPPRDYGGVAVPLDGFAQYQMQIATGGTPLGNLQLGDPVAMDFFGGEELHGSHGMSFAPVQQLHVDLQMLLAGSAFAEDILSEFTLVPEPSSIALAALGFLCVAKVFRRRKG